MDAPADAFHHHRAVQFVDTDMAGIVHFSNLFRFMEEAEHEWLRSLDLSVYLIHEGQKLSFPRRSAKCDFKSPLRFEETVDIAVWVGRMGEKSLTLLFRLSVGPRLVALGEIVTVCCRIEANGDLRSIPIPDSLLKRFGAKPKSE